ncbi:MAG: hypothetical protein B6D46_08540 [Polyangiaceae bacterium UTPRO1]|nr:hypothetical protein [Myxococcales bacterium]OQY66993.1 MAG: hypothetical protein B6D46_08540 [Polyangiaceae bacterium UTPRO1]
MTGFLLCLAGGCSEPVVIPAWDPSAFRDLATLEFRTVGPDEGPHWSRVWLVVVDGAVYVRLGSRAAGRMRANTTAPFVAVRIGGREYPRVRATDSPQEATRVAAAMASKYPSDLLVRHLSHPSTMRLEPEAESAP